MKKILSLIMLAVMMFTLAACGGGAVAEPVTINVFAAASMTETLNELKDMFAQENGDIEVVLTLDSSGTLKTQIEEGAACDMFISAAQKQMNALSELGMVDEATRIDFLQNKVALVVPDGNPKGITSFSDIGTEKVALIALGNSDVPVGQYSEEILTYMGVWQALNDGGHITFGTNVKEVTAQVVEGAVDCGIVYATDAAAAGLPVIDEAPKDSCSPVIYPAALMTGAANADAAKTFMEFLCGDEARAVFEAAGFTPLF